MAKKPTETKSSGEFPAEQYNFILGALARIDKKVDIMSNSLQGVKIDLVYLQEDLDEMRADVSELKKHYGIPTKPVSTDIDEFEEEFDI